MRHHNRVPGLLFLFASLVLCLGMAGLARAGLATSPLGVQGDPRVEHFTKVARGVATAFADAFMEMPFEARVSFVNGLKGMSCGGPACPNLKAHLANHGVAVEIANLAELRTSLTTLLSQGITEAQIVSSTVKVGGSEYTFHVIEDDGSCGEDCEACMDDCRQTYEIEALTAWWTYVSALAACTLTGPGWPICVASATFAYAEAVYLAGEDAEECVEECEETYGDGSNGESYCEEDEDCATDEWCDRGVILGIGQNECKPLKEEGEICTRDGQCESDCCKFYWYFWQCRPSDRC